jgi:hypothetical protein
MSRNFELMQNLGKEQEMFQAPLEATTTVEEPAINAPQPVELQPLQLKMEEAQRD